MGQILAQDSLNFLLVALGSGTLATHAHATAALYKKAESRLITEKQLDKISTLIDANGHPDVRDDTGAPQPHSGGGIQPLVAQVSIC